MTIKHLVLPGGGPNILYVYGVLKRLHSKQIWNYSDIESIHGTSAGAIMGLIIILNINWDDLDNYIINRPWEKVFSFSPQHFLDAYKNKGLLDISKIKTICEPLFKTADISSSITLKELYEHTGKEFYVYVTELNKFELVTISHKTHPDMQVISAVYLSSIIPPLFTPIIKEKCCYLDGGLFANYPLEQCIQNMPDVDINDILGIKFIINVDEKTFIDDNSNLSEYIFYIIKKLTGFIEKTKNNTINIKNEVLIKTNGCDLEFWNKMIYNKDLRESIINEGCEFADIYLEYKA